MPTFVQRFLQDRAGGVTITGVMVIVVIVVLAGGGIDFGLVSMQRKQLQQAADAAALGAARELQIASGSQGRIESTALAIVQANIQRADGVSVIASVLPGGSAVEVQVVAKPRTFFAGPISANVKQMTASAIAEVSGAPVCMIGLDTRVKHTLKMEKRARITARGCAIYSNSSHREGIRIDDNAQVAADFICSAGGVKTAKNQSLDPAAITDCPAMPDPLQSRPPPPVGSCSETKFEVAKKEARTLTPGVYCGGLTIKGSAKFASGVYIIKDGPLEVSDGGSLTGEGVGFYLTGKDALINFKKESSVSLTAPRSGPLAGLLFYEDRKVESLDIGGIVEINYGELTKPKEHRISSNDAGRLVGTIYISRNRLLVGGENPIAEESEYTVIVAREFVLAEGPEIVLNTDYELSEVPVPDGVGNRISRSTRLSK